MKRINFLICCFALFLVSSCKGKQERVLGRWEQISGPPFLDDVYQPIAFDRDGALRIAEHSFSFFWLDANNLKIKKSNIFGEQVQVFNVEFKHGRLVLKEEEGIKREFGPYEKVEPKISNLIGTWRRVRSAQGGGCLDSKISSGPLELSLDKDARASIIVNNLVETVHAKGTYKLEKNHLIADLEGESALTFAFSRNNKTAWKKHIDCAVSGSLSTLELGDEKENSSSFLRVVHRETAVSMSMK